MNILVDDNIPLGDAFFSTLGNVNKVAAKDLSSAHCQWADIMIVRSVVPIGEPLLRDSRVQFVGSCTAGTDHLDTAYLSSRDIAWTGAPGCNAASVVNYVFSTLACLRPGWRHNTIGIIGCGQVGGLLREKLLALGMAVRCYDPLLDQSRYPELTSLEAVLESDIVSIHAPLTRRGEHPSFHLLSRKKLQQLKPDALLISAGRGAVVDSQALYALMAQRPGLQVALDVWEEEPAVARAQVEKVVLGTPHIAGHSLDGKVRGTEIIYRKLCDFLRWEPGLGWADFDKREGAGTIELTAIPESTPDKVINAAILNAYDPRRDWRRYLGALSNGSSPDTVFYQQRKHYPVRREFDSFTLVPDSGFCHTFDAATQGKIIADLQLLGFDTHLC